MPSNPNPEGSPRLMTVSEIAEEYGISRQAIHTHRRRGAFPQSVPGEGSTRHRFRADEVKDFFERNPKQPGRRTDREPAPQLQQGEDVTDLVEFLRERLDEDEQVARATTPSPWTYGTGVVRGGPDRSPTVAREVSPGDYQHIARHDPARVLREVEAKRRIMELHGPGEFEYADGDVCMLCDRQGPEPYPCTTLRLLALPYADYPDYREEWRP